MATEFELLDAWRGGDRAAGAELLRSQFDRLYRLFRGKVGDHELAELIQQTLLTCVEQRDAFRGESQFSTYVFAIARSVLVRHYRRVQRETVIDPAQASVEDLAPSPCSVLVEHEQERLLLRALRRLPLDLQLLVELHYWERLSGPQLARVLEAPEGTIRTRLRRARSLLRDEMARVAASAALVESTMDDLARWAASLRERVAKTP